MHDRKRRGTEARALFVALALSALLGGCTRANEGALSIDLETGGKHEISATTDERVTNAEGSFEFDTAANASGKVRVTLYDPTGLVIAFRDINTQPGEHARAEAARGYSGTGPAGTYRATIEVMAGAAHLTRGEIAFRAASTS